MNIASSKVVGGALRISLIEAGDLSRAREWKQAEGSFSNRVSSITNESRDFLSSERCELEYENVEILM